MLGQFLRIKILLFVFCSFFVLTGLSQAAVTQVDLTADQQSPIINTSGPFLFNATAADGIGPQQYQFWVFDPNDGLWHMLQDYSTNDAFLFDPLIPGSYQVLVYAREAGSTAQYEALDTMWYHVVSDPPVTGVTLTSDKQSPLQAGDIINLVANSTGGTGSYEYQFWIWDLNSPCFSNSSAPECSGEWYRWQDYSPQDSMNFDFWVAGNYKFLVYSRSAGSIAKFEAQAVFNVNILDFNSVTQVNLTSDKQSPYIPVGDDTVTFTASALDGVGPQEYQFWLYNAASSQWTMKQDYSTTDTFQWSFLHYETPFGSSKIMVYARSAGSTAEYEAEASIWFDLLSDTPVSSVTLEMSETSPSELSAIGNVIVLATSDIEFTDFQFLLMSPDGTWSVLRDYSLYGGFQEIVEWTPAEEGVYQIVVNARALGNDTLYDARASAWFVVTNSPPVTSVRLSADNPSPLQTGEMVNLIANATGGSGSYEYQFWLWDKDSPCFISNSSTPSPPECDGEWLMWWDYGWHDWMSFEFFSSGRYIFKVYARSVGSTVAFESQTSMTYMVADDPPVTQVSLVANVPSPVSVVDISGPVEFTAAATDGTGQLEYQFWIKRDEKVSTWTMAQDYSIVNTLIWDIMSLEPPVEGNHQIKVYARSAGSTLEYEAQATIELVVVYDRPVTEVSLVADKPSPSSLSSVGTVIFNSTASGGNCSEPPVYQYWLMSPEGAWALVRDYDDPLAPDSQWSWTPLESGSYKVMVYAKCGWSQALYEAEASMWFNVSIGDPVTGVTLSADRTSPLLEDTMYGQDVTFIANALDGAGPQEYQFWIWDKGSPCFSYNPAPECSGEWYRWQDYSSQDWMSFNFYWTGHYKVHVYSRGAGSLAQFEAEAGMGFDIVSSAPVTEVSLTADKTSPAELSSVGTVILNAVALDGTGPQEYQFWVHDPSTSQWNMLQDYSTTDSAPWTPTLSGSYQILVYSRSSGSIADYEAYKTLWFNVSDNQPVTGVTLVTDKSEYSLLSTVGIVNITAGALDGTGPQEYQFWLYDPNAGKWNMLRDYGTSAYFAWTPTATGSYQILVYARSAGSTNAYEAQRSIQFHLVNDTPVTGVTLTPDKQSPLNIGDIVTLTANATGGTGTYEYQFWVWDRNSPCFSSSPPAECRGEWYRWQDYTSQDWMSFNFNVVGDYQIAVYTRNAGSDAKFEAQSGKYFAVQ